MKKITTIILAVLFSIIGYGQGDFNVPVNYGSRQASDFQKRVIDDAGTYYPNVAAHNIDERKSYGLNPVFEFYPAASKEGTLYSQKPTDGSGDFTVTRDAFSTTLNEDGYYQNMLPNYPLIDYTNGYPVTLTQPQRIRLTTRPLSFGHSDWTKSGATIEGDASSTGTELITDSDDRDFTGGDIGNWIVNTDGNGTVIYSTDIIKEGKILVGATAGTYTTALLPSSAATTLVDGNMYLYSVDIYIPSGNNNFTEARIYFSAFTGMDNAAYVDLTVEDEWQTVSVYGTAAADVTGNLGVRGASTTTGDIIYFDNITIKEVTGYPSPMLEPDLGSDIITPLDFTSGWTNLGGITDKTATTYTTTSAGGVYSYDMLTIGTNYKIVFTSDNSTVTVRNYDGAAHDPIILTGSGEIYFVAEYTKLYIRNNGAATTIVSELTIQEILPTATTPMTESYLMTATGADGYIELATPLAISNTTDYTNSIFIKRVTGIGDISIKDINNAETVISGGTETTDGWSRYDVTSESTSTDGQIGVKLATSGDEVLLFFAQSELTYPTTPIWNGSEGATVTRVADSPLTISAANSTDYDFTSEDFSMSFDFNADEIPETGQTIYLYSKGTYNASGWIVYLTTSTINMVSGQSGVIQITSSTNAIVINTETNIVVTRSGAVGKIYKNGIDITTTSETHIDPISSIAVDLKLGSNSSDGNNFRGTIDKFVIYNKTLTPTEVLNLQ